MPLVQKRKDKVRQACADDETPMNILYFDYTLHVIMFQKV
jgi:hypothetical protein